MNTDTTHTDTTHTDNTSADNTKRILVTGANRGLGLELARQYHEDGWEVLPTCREPADAHDLHDLGLTPLPLDVNNPDDIANLAYDLDGVPLDILFNNAGIFGPREIPFGDLPTKPWLDVLHTNAIAPFLLSQALSDNVITSQDRCLAFMSSGLGSIANTKGGEYIYRSAKAALNMGVATLAQDLAQYDACVVAISPGWVRTDMGGTRAPLSARASVEGIKHVLDTLTPAQSGSFLSHEGEYVDW